MVACVCLEFRGRKPAFYVSEDRKIFLFYSLRVGSFSSFDMLLMGMCDMSIIFTDFVCDHFAPVGLVLGITFDSGRIRG